MITFAAIASHVLLNFLEGWAVSRHISSIRWGAGRISLSILTGIYIETLFTYVLLAAGFPVLRLPAALLLFTVILIFFSLRLKKAGPLLPLPKPGIFRPRWYEIAVVVLLSGKVIFALWVIQTTPVYFDDALTHWSARGRAIFGVLNWSFDPDSPLFMGFTGHKHYPLMIPIWRATTAAFSGEWNDIFARVDGILLFVLVIVTVWSSVASFTESRLLAAVSAFLLLSLPFHVWHSFSGFADIGVEVFCAASMAALLRREWFLAGILAAGTAWAKNDGLALFIPQLFFACILMQRGVRDAAVNGAKFIAAAATLFPWIIFKFIYLPGIAPGKEGLSWHGDIFSQFMKIVVNGPTHTLFWVFTAAVFMLTPGSMLRNRTGRAMLAFCFTSFSGIIFVFGMTDAYLFLVNEMTIHRTMLQYYGVSVMICVYSVSLSLKERRESWLVKIPGAE